MKHTLLILANLLSITEILGEIKKFKALINTLRLDGYHERKKIL